MKRSAHALLVVLSCTAALLASPQQPQRPPVFRSTVDIVQLDVTVLDKDRRPVRGLTQADFTVLEDGKPQPVVAFKSFDVEDAPPPPLVKWMRDVTPDVTDNGLESSRLFVIVVDDACIPGDPQFEASTRAIVQRVIDKLGPNDLTSIIFTGDNRGTQDFTNDKSKLSAAMVKFHPGLAVWAGKGADTDIHYFVSAIATLSSVADYLIAVPGKRKTLVWVSPGVPVDFGSEAPMAIMNGTSFVSMFGREGQLSMIDETKKTFQRAQRANVAVYPIDPTGLGGLLFYQRGRDKIPTGVPERAIDFLKMTAENTGGHAVVNTNDFESGIEQIFRENSSYYLLGFQSALAKVGGNRRLEVRVNRPGVEVHTRSQYEAATPDKPSAKAAPSELAKAISGILPTGDLPMQVTLAPFTIPGKRAGAVVIALGVQQRVPVEARNSQVTLTTELLTSAFTPEGDARGSQRSTAKVALRPGADGDASYEVLSRIDLPPGRYRLRLAAHDKTNERGGSVFADVDVPDFARAPLSMSGVILSASPGKASAPKDVLAGLVPVVPTAVREFLATDRVKSFLQVYQDGRVTIAPVNLVIRITDAHDAVRIDEKRVIPAERFGTAPTTTPAPVGRSTTVGPAPPRGDLTAATMATTDVDYALPVDRLPVGEYLLTIAATLRDQTVRRNVRFSVR